MTPPPPPSAVEYDTTAAAAAAAATTAPPPPSTSTEDPDDECVLCCYPLSLKENESSYYPCCGQTICNGCIVAQQRTLIIGTNVKKPIKGSKEEELEFMTILASEKVMVCPFCRAEDSTNNKEVLKRLWEQIDEYKDPQAMLALGVFYREGEHGLSKNLKKAEELYQQAYDLGARFAAYNLAKLYTEEIPDEARMMKYLEEGVKRGNTHCNNHLGFLAAKSGKHEEAKRQFMTAACFGHDTAMNNLMVCYRAPGSVVPKDDLTTALRAHKAINDARKSEPREYAIRHKALEKKLRAEHG